MPLNIIIQKGGAHTETIPMFVELLDKKCKVFYPTKSSITAYEDSIRRKYCVDFIKTDENLKSIIANTEDHGILIFNTAVEIATDWGQQIIKTWHGKTVVYNHEAKGVPIAGLLHFFAHPFEGDEGYLLPVSNVFNGIPRKNYCGESKTTLVMPNWSRPTQVDNKNLQLLDSVISKTSVDKYRFLMTGMSIEVMQQALARIENRNQIVVMPQLDVGSLSSLLLEHKTFVMPLIHPKGRYASQGLTGSIPLALNHCCPLIISKELADTYGLQAYVDENKLLDLLPLSDAAYSSEVEASDRDRMRLIEINRVRFRKKLNG